MMSQPPAHPTHHSGSSITPSPSALHPTAKPPSPPASSAVSFSLGIQPPTPRTSNPPVQHGSPPAPHTGGTATQLPAPPAPPPAPPAPPTAPSAPRTGTSSVPDTSPPPVPSTASPPELVPGSIPILVLPELPCALPVMAGFLAERPAAPAPTSDQAREVEAPKPGECGRNFSRRRKKPNEGCADFPPLHFCLGMRRETLEEPPRCPVFTTPELVFSAVDQLCPLPLCLYSLVLNHLATYIHPCLIICARQSPMPGNRSCLIIWPNQPYVMCP